MKKFLLKCILLISLVGSTLWVGGFAYRQTNTYINLERTEETAHYADMPEHINFAVFGSSHGRDAFPSLSGNSFNFSMSSQTPQYDAAQMRQFADRIQPGATVVLTYSYFSPFWTDSEDEFLKKQPRYYRILSPQNIIDVDLPHWYLERFSPLLTRSFSDVLSAFMTPATPTAPATSTAPTTPSHFSEEKIEREQSRIKRDHVPLITPACPGGNSVMLQAYREMLSLCQERGWNAILLTPPYPDAYTDCFDGGILDEFRRLGNELSSEFGVPWFDYSEDIEFQTAYDNFRNIDHLNSSGAELLKQRFSADLNAPKE